ncbi:MAG: ABC-type transport auxiliary lipoprotein family protein [Sulfurimonadaceae bacterium]
MNYIVVIFLGVVIFNGCSIQNKVPPAAKYSLSVDLDVNATQESLYKEQVLRIGPIESSPLLSGRNIYYSSDNGQSYHYIKARWMENVNNQLSNLIMRSITKTAIFKDVVPLRSLAKNDLILEINLYDFSQVIHDDGTTTLHISLKMRLVEQYTRRVVTTQLFEMEQIEQEGNVEGAIKGYNTLVSKLLSEMNSWLQQSCTVCKEEG